MNDDIALPEPDRVPGAPHPRETLRVIGQDSAAATFFDAYSSGRMHHAWLLTGPRGIGKATLAWSIARFLLATPERAEAGLFGDAPAVPQSLAIPRDNPVARRMLGLGEPRLFLLRRGPNDRGDRLSTEIRVDEVRRLQSFLHLSSADGGWRVVIVDAADEMTVSAANALLKLLEEPPASVTFLLVSHQPSSLLPTIRSRCRDLRLQPLSPADLLQAAAAAGVETLAESLAELAGGSVGEAVRLALLDGPATYGRLVGLFATLPRLDRARAVALSETAAARGNEEKSALVFTLADTFLARMARRGAMQHDLPEAAEGESPLFARLSPGPVEAMAWADLQASLGGRIRHGRAVNLDPAALLLDMVVKIAETAGRLA